MSGRAGLTPWVLIRSQWLLLLTIVLYLLAFLLAPERALRALQIGSGTFVSMLLLIVAVFSLVGVLQVWISGDAIARLLGREGGLKGLLVAVLCGTILIGPPYIIFPLLMNLRKLGARWAVVTIVLAAYALKPQMLPIEIEFLGWPFALARSLATLVLAIPIGLAVEALMERPG